MCIKYGNQILYTIKDTNGILRSARFDSRQNYFTILLKLCYNLNQLTIIIFTSNFIIMYINPLSNMWKRPLLNIWLVTLTMPLQRWVENWKSRLFLPLLEKSKKLHNFDINLNFLLWKSKVSILLCISVLWHDFEITKDEIGILLLYPTTEILAPK